MLFQWQFINQTWFSPLFYCVLLPSARFGREFMAGYLGTGSGLKPGQRRRSERASSKEQSHADFDISLSLSPRVKRSFTWDSALWSNAELLQSESGKGGGVVEIRGILMFVWQVVWRRRMFAAPGGGWWRNRLELLPSSSSLDGKSLV